MSLLIISETISTKRASGRRRLLHRLTGGHVLEQDTALEILGVGGLNPRAPPRTASGGSSAPCCHPAQQHQGRSSSAPIHWPSVRARRLWREGGVSAEGSSAARAARCRPIRALVTRICHETRVVQLSVSSLRTGTSQARAQQGRHTLTWAGASPLPRAQPAGGDPASGGTRGAEKGPRAHMANEFHTSFSKAIWTAEPLKKEKKTRY